jgi:FlaA1/EpsC-like NDP-sugar epimerase
MAMASGAVSIKDLRDLEIEDLLGREQVPPDERLLRRNIQGRVVLVSGAGGSIGSELCRQIAAAKPAKLLLLELSEYNLYAIHQELTRTVGPEVLDPGAIIPLLGSVTDERRVSEILSVWRPQTIFHAAAYKHVPLVEYNTVDGVRNNVIGTLTLARAAQEYDCLSFVLISTDKAVRPTNIMGASKRIAEMILQALQAEGSSTTFSSVRFGNVLGSSGSVVPLFRGQITAGGPITITHPDITRYFMTIPEASQLVLQAGAMAAGGEVFLLDMGEPVKIMDLARNIVELSGLAVRDENRPDGDIEIKVVGLRPGEKLYEELLIGDDPLPTEHPRIMRSHETLLPWIDINPLLEELRTAIDAGDALTIRKIGRLLVPEYAPNSPLVDCVSCAKIEKRRAAATV